MIKYAVFKTSGATPSEARHWLGKDKAVLDTLGIESTSSSSSEDSDEETDYSDSESLRDSSEIMPNHSLLTQALSASNFNWFEFREKVECMMKNNDSNDISKTLEELFLQIPHMDFSQSQIQHIVQSHCAFEAAASHMNKRELPGA